MGGRKPGLAGDATRPQQQIVDQWIQAYRKLFERLDLHATREQLAFQELLNLAAGPERRASTTTERRHPAIPTPPLLALIFAGRGGGGAPDRYGRSRERLAVHGLMVAGVTAVVAAGLLVVQFLDHPYPPHLGGIQPSAMRQTVVTVRNLDPSLRAPCTQSGLPA